MSDDVPLGERFDRAVYRAARLIKAELRRVRIECRTVPITRWTVLPSTEIVGR